VTLLQIEVFFLVFRVREVLRESLDLSEQTFNAVIDWLDFLLSHDVRSFGLLYERRLCVAHNSAGLTQSPISDSITGRLLLLSLLARASFHKYLVVHAPLDNEQTRCDEGLLEKLSLKHFHQVFNPEFLSLLGILRRGLAAVILSLVRRD